MTLWGALAVPPGFGNAVMQDNELARFARRDRRAISIFRSREMSKTTIRVVTHSKLGRRT